MSFDDLDYLTYEEAAKLIGINPKSVSSFASKNNIRRGYIVLRGKKRGIVDAVQFRQVIERKNYLRKPENEVPVWG